jgi:hypothetical protein
MVKMQTGTRRSMAIKTEEMVKYDLYTFLKEELGNGSKDLVTRPSGQAIRERIERDMEKEPAGAVVALDFSKIGIIDYSCADEIVTKLVSRLLSGEYGDKYLMLAGLNENQKENIEVALERKDLAVMAEMRDGARAVLGNRITISRTPWILSSKRKRPHPGNFRTPGRSRRIRAARGS